MWFTSCIKEAAGTPTWDRHDDEPRGTGRVGYSDLEAAFAKNTRRSWWSIFCRLLSRGQLIAGGGLDQADGQTIASASDDGTVNIWPVH